MAKRIATTACIGLLAAVVVPFHAADSAETFKRDCAIVEPKTLQLVLKMLDPVSDVVGTSIECHSDVCVGTITFDGSEIYSFESTQAAPKELCSFGLRTIDLKAAGSKCDGELNTMRFNIGEPGRYREDFKGVSVQVEFSSSKAFSPAKCIPKESVQFVPEFSGITYSFESPRARVEVTRF
jgi:hypothetical protein